MFTLFDSGNRYPRREMLRVGAGAFAGAFGALSGFGNRALAQSKGLPISDRSVILLFLHGGPTQIETFDPKMGAPEGVRSGYGRSGHFDSRCDLRLVVPASCQAG